MGIDYLYYNEDDKEFLDPEQLHESVNGKWPVGIVASNVLFRLLQGPWNGKRIHCINDCGDYPWLDESSADYNALKPGWSDAAKKHWQFVVQPAVASALEILADAKLGNAWPITLAEAELTSEGGISLMDLYELLDARVHAVPTDRVLEAHEVLNALLCGFTLEEEHWGFSVRLVKGALAFSDPVYTKGQVYLFDPKYHWWVLADDACDDHPRSEKK